MRREQRRVVTVGVRKADEPRKDQVLTYAAFVFAAALLAHGADHMRRGLKVLTPEVYWAGMALSALAVISIILVVARHSWGPWLSVVVGLPMAVAVTASHLLPHWSSFSDAFPGSAADRWSYAAVLFEVTGALLFGLAGLRVLLRPAQSKT